MKITVHVIHETDPALERKLDRYFGALFKQQEIIMATLKDVQDSVHANTDVVNSAITLIAGIKAQLDAAIAAEDPAALQALSDELGKSDADLAAAVAANTAPVDPVPVSAEPVAG